MELSALSHTHRGLNKSKITLYYTHACQVRAAFVEHFVFSTFSCGCNGWRCSGDATFQTAAPTPARKCGVHAWPLDCKKHITHCHAQLAKWFSTLIALNVSVAELISTTDSESFCSAVIVSTHLLKQTMRDDKNVNRVIWWACWCKYDIREWKQQSDFIFVCPAACVSVFVACVRALCLFTLRMFPLAWHGNVRRAIGKWSLLQSLTHQQQLRLLWHSMTLSGDPHKTLLSRWLCSLFSYNLELHVLHGGWWNTETLRSLHPLKRCSHHAVCSCVFHLELSNFPLNVYLFAKDSCGGKFCNCIILFPYRCCRLRLIFTPWLGSVLTSHWLQGVLCSPQSRLYCLTCAQVLTEV